MINFDKKDVITALNREEAEIYIGEKGYYCYRNNDWRPCELVRVYLKDDDFDVRNVFTILDHKTEHECPMFLPADKVKKVEEEKKYRPFKNVDEFTHILGVSIGEVVIFRSKEKTQQKGEIHTILVGYLKTENGDDGIIFGGSNGSWSLQDIFENLEWKSKRDGEWQPFGVLDES